MAGEWWQSFFDETYLELWAGLFPAEVCEAEADALWELLRLGDGDRVLDAPCGYGRVSLPLARRGAIVTGVDFSPAMLAAAKKERDELGLEDAVTLVEADLRKPLAVGEFAAAINLFSSLGYGTRDDDRAILRTIAGSLRSGGRFFIDTIHRDVVVARRTRGDRPGAKMPGGVILTEELRFDPIRGVVDTTWSWIGPAGSGEKSGTIRSYTITELIELADSCDFRFISAHQGTSAAPFEARPKDGGGRVGLLFERVGETTAG